MGEDEVVIQVETDKVTIDIRSPGAGVVQEVLVSESDVVTVLAVVPQTFPVRRAGAAGTKRKVDTRTFCLSFAFHWSRTAHDRQQTSHI